MISRSPFPTRAALSPALLGLFALVGLQGACADFQRGPATPAATMEGGVTDGVTDGATNAETGALSFATTINGLLVAACQRCHAPGQEAGDTALLLPGDAVSDLAVVIPFIDVGAPASSRLLAKMSGQGHGGGTVYASDSPQYQTILQWIQQGARP